MSVSASKDALVAMLDSSVARPLLSWALRDRALIIMFHRFEHRDLGVHGDRIEDVTSMLALLRKAKVDFVPLDDLVSGLARGGDDRRNRRPQVAITIDDGYTDALDIGAPAFAAYDCPATVFVVPGVIDGNDWFWWDKVAFMLARTSRSRMDVEIGQDRVTATLGTSADSNRVGHDLIERLKRVPNHERLASLVNLEKHLDVQLPIAPPAQYQVSGWEDLRESENDGLRFGAHTQSHPILRMCSDAESIDEMHRSLDRVRAELKWPSGVFCYPNGTEHDFGARETTFLESQGLLGAVSTVPGTISVRGDAPRSPVSLYRLPRVVFDHRPGAMLRALLLPIV